MRGLFLLLLVSGCARESTLFIAPSWPSEENAVVLITDEELRPLREPWLHQPSGVSFTSLNADAIRIFVRTYKPAAEHGPDLAGCGVTLSQGHKLLPQPSSSLSSGLLDVSDDMEVALHQESEPHSFNLRYGCAINDGPCISTRTTDWVSPDDQRLLVNDVAVISRDLIFFGGYVIDGGQKRSVIGTLRDADVITIVELPSRFVEVRSLVWDNRGTVFGYDDGGLLFQADDSGSLLVEIPAPDQPMALTGGETGVFAYSADRLFELVVGSTTTHPMTAPDNLISLVSVDDDRFGAISATGIHYFDGRTWQREVSHSFEPVSILSEEGSFIAGDRSVMVVNESGFLAIRDESSKRWDTSITDPFTIFGQRAGDGLGDGRFFIVGEHGSAALLVEDQWCQMTGSTRFDFVRADAGADGKILTAIAKETGPVSVFYIIELVP